MFTRFCTKKEAPAAAANKRKREEIKAEKKARLRRQRLLGEAVAPRGPLLTLERDFRDRAGCWNSSTRC